MKELLAVLRDELHDLRSALLATDLQPHPGNPRDPYDEMLRWYFRSGQPVVDVPVYVAPIAPLYAVDDEGNVAALPPGMSFDYSSHDPMFGHGWLEEFYSDATHLTVLREFYSPWIALFLFNLATRVVPTLSQCATPFEVRKKLVKIGHHDEFARVFVFERIAWASIVDFRSHDYEEAPSIQVARRVESLVALHSKARGRPNPMEPAVIDTDPPRSLLTAMRTLSEDGIYDSNRKSMDEAYHAVWTFYRDAPDPAIQTALRNFLLESRSIARLRGSLKEAMKVEFRKYQSQEDITESDLVSDAETMAFLRISDRLDSYEPARGVPLTSYLHGALKSAPKEFRRELAGDASVDECHPHSFIGAIAHVDDAEAWKRIKKTFTKKLTPTELKVFKADEDLGLGYGKSAEIAKRCGLSSGSVRVHRCNYMKKFREACQRDR